ncbi:MAG: hypothetical protein WDO69_08630 [Pseudomonadota bacterium]
MSSSNDREGLELASDIIQEAHPSIIELLERPKALGEISSGERILVVLDLSDECARAYIDSLGVECPRCPESGRSYFIVCVPRGNLPEKVNADLERLPPEGTIPVLVMTAGRSILGLMPIRLRRAPTPN